MTAPRGIDISHWQATTPPLAGLAFVFVKASEGLAPDPAYGRHAAAVTAAGLVLGAYCFARDDVSINGQAAAFVRRATGAEILAVDVEGGHGTDRAQTAALISSVKSFDPLHRPVGLYVSESAFFEAGQDFDWVAHWRVAAPARHWTFHQYRGAPLDLDRYNGTLTQLHALAGRPATAPKPAPKPKPPRPPRPAKAFHTVVRGDNLSAIAAAHGITLRRLLGFPENARFRDNPNLIFAGARVRIH